MRYQQSRLFRVWISGSFLYTHADDGYHIRIDDSPPPEESAICRRAPGK